MDQLVSAIAPRLSIRDSKHQTILVQTDRVFRKIATEYSRVIAAAAVNGVVAAVAADSVVTIIAIYDIR